MEHFATGALPDPIDLRDYKADMLLAASPAIDWTPEGYFLPRPPLWNQQSSDSCVSAAWGYYKWQDDGKDYCRKSLFAYIAQQYGAYIRDGGVRLVNFGIETTDETPDPEVRTPASMRDKTGLNEKDALDSRILDSRVVPNDIENTAKAIRDWKGVVFGVIGTYEGWVDKANPVPPPPTTMSDKLWGHALYLYGYHLHDGQKCVVARSSWDEVDHHIKENYFASGNTFNPWTLVPRKESMKLINDNGTIFIVGELGKIGIADIGTLEKLSKVTAIVEAGSTANIPQVGVIKQVTMTSIVDN